MERNPNSKTHEVEREELCEYKYEGQLLCLLVPL